ncbi:hypothetical protein DERF_013100, partial [Dermatophagoides farinae]
THCSDFVVFIYENSIKIRKSGYESIVEGIILSYKWGFHNDFTQPITRYTVEGLKDLLPKCEIIVKAVFVLLNLIQRPIIMN